VARAAEETEIKNKEVAMVIVLGVLSVILLFALIGALEQVHHLRVQLHILSKTSKNLSDRNDQY